MDSLIFAGFDVGSRTTKLAVFQSGKLIETYISDSGMEPHKTVSLLWNKHKDKYPANRSIVVSTGYGRNVVPFADKIISEITCQAKGIHWLFPHVKTIIDIGGQDSKVILKDNFGRVIDFVMNDKCAAGTGRFLEMTATIFGIAVSELGNLAMKSEHTLKINNTCVVFAESEIINLIASQYKKEDIIAAIHFSIASRIKSMFSPLQWSEPFAFTGGVAQNAGMVSALSQIWQFPLIVPPDSSLTCAIGAALLAGELKK
jgi:predicted CoA-substrate-specific enzyme activase